MLERTMPASVEELIETAFSKFPNDTDAAIGYVDDWVGRRIKKITPEWLPEWLAGLVHEGARNMIGRKMRTERAKVRLPQNGLTPEKKLELQDRRADAQAKGTILVWLDRPHFKKGKRLGDGKWADFDENIAIRKVTRTTFDLEDRFDLALKARIPNADTMLRQVLKDSDVDKIRRQVEA